MGPFKIGNRFRVFRRPQPKTPAQKKKKIKEKNDCDRSLHLCNRMSTKGSQFCTRDHDIYCPIQQLNPLFIENVEKACFSDAKCGDVTEFCALLWLFFFDVFPGACIGLLSNGIFREFIFFFYFYFPADRPQIFYALSPETYFPF